MDGMAKKEILNVHANPFVYKSKQVLEQSHDLSQMAYTNYSWQIVVVKNIFVLFGTHCAMAARFLWCDTAQKSKEKQIKPFLIYHMSVITTLIPRKLI